MAICVALTDPIAKPLIETLEAKANVTVLGNGRTSSSERLIESLNGAHAVISLLTSKFTDEIMCSSPQLLLIANIAVGYDNIDIPAANRHGILVTNTPGVLDETTADLAFALLMALSRRIVEADKFVRDGQWIGFDPDLMLGVDVHGKTLGIVGLGRIGKAVAKRALGFSMNVVYAGGRQENYQLTEEFACLKHVSLDELLSISDIVSLHCPLKEDTYHLIGARELSLLRRGSLLINTARGAIVDERALIAALVSGHLGGAGLDVFEYEPTVPHELIGMKNVVLAPHIGSATGETRMAMSALAVKGVLSALAGKLPLNAVNPEIWPDFKKRLLEQAL